jgi:hypothetical protein
MKTVTFTIEPFCEGLKRFWVPALPGEQPVEKVG